MSEAREEQGGNFPINQFVHCPGVLDTASIMLQISHSPPNLLLPRFFVVVVVVLPVISLSVNILDLILRSGQRHPGHNLCVSQDWKGIDCIVRGEVEWGRKNTQTTN